MKRPGLLVKWLITAALLLVQIHICQAAYVLPTGRTCLVCPKIEEDGHTQAQIAAKDQHGDCHDCCELRECDDAGKVKAKIAPPILSLAMALPIALLTVPVIQELEERVTTYYIEGCPPTGPPSSTRSRAPPLQLS
jgi:hypothetical protein